MLLSQALHADGIGLSELTTSRDDTKQEPVVRKRMPTSEKQGVAHSESDSTMLMEQAQLNRLNEAAVDAYAAVDIGGEWGDEL